MICVSQFSGDGIWYRARIIEVPGNKDVVVQYVDYGNTERVSVFNLKKILDSFLILPAQVFEVFECGVSYVGVKLMIY